MVKKFDPDLIVRNIRLRFEEHTDQRMERRVRSVANQLRLEQAKLFTVLATQAIGTKSTPKSIWSPADRGTLKGGSVPWENLTDGWRKEKSPINRDRFFINTGHLAEQLMVLSPFEVFGIPDYYRGKRLKNDAKYTWTIRLYPALGRKYPQFAGLEKHTAFFGIGQKFYARQTGGKDKPYIKRPFLQPFLITWNYRLKNVITRTLIRSDSSNTVWMNEVKILKRDK